MRDTPRAEPPGSGRPGATAPSWFVEPYAGYGVLTATNESDLDTTGPYSATLTETFTAPGTTLRFSVGRRAIWPRLADLALFYDLQIIGDASRYFHYYSANVGRVPAAGKGGFRMRSGLGVMGAQAGFDTSALTSLAFNTGIGYTFGLGRGSALSLDFPLAVGISLSMRDDVADTTSTLALQIGMTFGPSSAPSTVAQR